MNGLTCASMRVVLATKSGVQKQEGDGRALDLGEFTKAFEDLLGVKGKVSHFPPPEC